jgi:serine/threonine protein kinase
VLDFGISKILGSSTVQTADQSLLGTPNFMAPEQFNVPKRRIGSWTDIFSMGAILYQMVSGKPAFDG